MNDRSLLRAVLVLAVLSLATNVLVLKDLRASEDALTPPANYLPYMVGDLERMLFKIEVMVDEGMLLTNNGTDEVLMEVFEFENRLDNLPRSPVHLELDQTARKLRELVMDQRSKEDVKAVIWELRDLLRGLGFRG